jgi:hypothetical protein
MVLGLGRTQMDASKRTPRREKICNSCVYYVPEIDGYEEECNEDEDPGSSEWCDSYEKKQ